jgi:hypothetical protein
MASIANICWDFVPGSLSTLVEYRVSGDDVWIQPTSPSNPTTTNCYPITIEDNVYYDVRLTTNGIRCAPRSRTMQIVSASGCCPVGYVLSEDETYCLQVNETAATPPSTPETTVAKTNSFYSDCGTYIYDAGYASDGTGTSTQISTSNSFWRNGSGTCAADGNTSDGPMNRCALWSTTEFTNQDIGFSVCVNIETPQTYYIGFGCDNYGILRIDGNTIFEQDPTALDVQYGIIGAPFHVWHIYPVALSVGQHIIEMVGHNVATPAAMGAEIYQNTIAEIISATSYGMLNIVFSTKDYVGEDVQLGTDGVGYTCPVGYSLVFCEGPAFCRQVLTTSIIPCTTSTTTTTTTTL